MPPNQPIIRGKDALKKFYDDLLAVAARPDLKMNVAEVSGHGPLAYQSGTYEMELKPADRRARPRSRQVPVRAAQDATTAGATSTRMWNSDLPPPPPARGGDRRSEVGDRGQGSGSRIGSLGSLR